MGREVTQHWLKYIDKFCDVYFRESLYSCCWSNLGLAQPQSRMAAHKVTQPLPACSSMLYWQWTGKTIFYGKFKGHSFNTSCCYPKKFLLHHQTVSDKFFCKIIGDHWFPAKSDIAQFLCTSFLAVNSIFERRSRHLLTYLLTHSMEQSPSWEANQ